MNKAIVFAIGMLVGAGITAGVSYFIIKKTRKQEEERADKEIHEMELYFKRRRKAVEEADEAVNENEKKKEEVLNNVRHAIEDEAEPVDRIEGETDHDREQRILHEYQEKLMANGYQSKYARDIHIRTDLPYVITINEYNDPNFSDYYKDLRFKYFSDGTVLNELDEELDMHEVEDSIGDEFMEFFRDNPDEEECYVRNDQRRIDYVVQRVHEYYEEIKDRYDSEYADDDNDNNDYEGDE